MRRITCILAMMFAALAASCAPGSDDASKNGIPYVDTGVDPEAWARVPAGEFFRDQHAIETMVDYDYEIMVTPVTNSQYARYLDEALAAGDIKIVEDKIMGHYPGEPFDGHNHEFEVKAGDKLHIALNSPGLRIVYDGRKFSVIKGFENHPMVMVTWFGANAYCEFYGWRLPTEFEWEKAARGTDERAYPWGDEIAHNQANYYSSRHLFGKMFGENGDGCGVCGILGILGVLANGSYALCGIGETVPDFVFGHSGTDRLEEVWNNTRVLQEFREGLPQRLEGTCGDCLMKGVCLGSCVAQNYYRTKNFWAPNWYCEQAYDLGLFPESRILTEKVTKR